MEPFARQAKKTFLLREVRVIEPYMYKPGSRMAGQKWKEVADNVNSYESFSEKSPGSEERERAFSEITRGLKSKDEKGRNFKWNKP